MFDPGSMAASALGSLPQMLGGGKTTVSTNTTTSVATSVNNNPTIANIIGGSGAVSPSSSGSAGASPYTTGNASANPGSDSSWPYSSLLNPTTAYPTTRTSTLPTTPQLAGVGVGMGDDGMLLLLLIGAAALFFFKDA